jgi:hypothetical protein
VTVIDEKCPRTALRSYIEKLGNNRPDEMPVLKKTLPWFNINVDGIWINVNRNVWIGQRTGL